MALHFEHDTKTLGTHNYLQYTLTNKNCFIFTSSGEDKQQEGKKLLTKKSLRQEQIYALL